MFFDIFLALQGSKLDRKVTWVNRFLFQQKKRRYRIRIAGRKCCPYPQSPTLKNAYLVSASSLYAFCCQKAGSCFYVNIKCSHQSSGLNKCSPLRFSCILWNIWTNTYWLTVNTEIIDPKKCGGTSSNGFHIK